MAVGTPIRLLISALLACSTSLLSADTLVLESGRALNGRITAETGESVTIEAAAGRFTFPRAQVRRISRESAVSNQLLELEQYLLAGKIDAAMLVYHNTDLASTLTDDSLAGSFMAQLKDTANGAIATSPTAALLADKFIATGSAPSELLILTAALLADHGQFDRVQTLLRLAEQRRSTKLLWPVETVTALLDRIATSALNAEQGNVLAASAALAARLPISQKTMTPNYLSLYAQIDSMIRNGDYLHASTRFHPDMFLHRADLFIPLAERLITAVLAAPGSSAIPTLESARSTVFPYIEKELQVRSLKALTNKLIDSDREQEARALADEVSSIDADTGALLVHLLDFRQRRARLTEDTPLETYKLAAWAKSMGLLDEAEALFLSLRGDPRFAETVNLQLDIIEQTQAAASVRRLRQLYDTNAIDDLKRETAIFLHAAPPEQYAQEARNLLQLVDFEKWSNTRASHGKAEAEFQQAERFANRGEYDAALTHLNQIQMDRQDSEAAQKAVSLRDRIMREKLKQQAKERDAAKPPGSAP